MIKHGPKRIRVRIIGANLDRGWATRRREGANPWSDRVSLEPLFENRFCWRFRAACTHWLTASDDSIYCTTSLNL